MLVTKRVKVSCELDLTFDDNLVPDDEWRMQFHDLADVDDLACHLAYNVIVNHATLSSMEGFADHYDEELEVYVDDYETEVLR